MHGIAPDHVYVECRICHAQRSYREMDKALRRVGHTIYSKFGPLNILYITSVHHDSKESFL